MRQYHVKVRACKCLKVCQLFWQRLCDNIAYWNAIFIVILSCNEKDLYFVKQLVSALIIIDNRPTIKMLTNKYNNKWHARKKRYYVCSVRKGKSSLLPFAFPSGPHSCARFSKYIVLEIAQRLDRYFPVPLSLLVFAKVIWWVK